MDKIDKKIIELLQSNARYSLKYLAEQVYLSTPAVSARIEKLEDSGIIVGYSAVIDKSKLGFNITAFINLELASKDKEKFYQYIIGRTNVIECSCITGKFSILLKVVYQTTTELDHFIDELQKFGNTETQIVFSSTIENRGVSPFEEVCS